jgi:superfamily II DNA or RNA helicase
MTVRLTRAEIEQLKALEDPIKIKGLIQDRALREWEQALCRGTFEAATGTGKTRVAVLACARELERNPDAVIYIGVPTTTLRDNDWPEEFRKWGYEHLIPKIKFVCHVAMDKIEEPKEEIDLFVFDEIHNVTVINTTVFSKCKVYKVLGLTATLPSLDGYPSDRDKRLIVDSLAPSVFKVSLEEAIELKLVSDFEVYVMKFDLDDKDAYVDSGTKKKAFKTTELKHYKYVTKGLQRAAYKNPAAKFYWIQKRMSFLYSLRQKELLAREIMDQILVEKGEAKRTLLFCGGIEQANKLCGEWVYHSKVSDQYLKEFQQQKIPYLGVVQALNEGKNVEQLDQILVIQLNSKELDIIQRIGRTIRFREGHVARVIVLIAKDTVDEKWYESAFENFDKKRIKEFYVRTTTSASKAA